MHSIVETRDNFYNSLWRRDIVGLNIFAANELDDEPNPRLAFLSALMKTYSCAAHVDTVAMAGEQPEEYFSSAIPKNYLRTEVKLYGGSFYEQDIESSACFFPVAPQSLLSEHGDDLILYDTLALYVGVPDPESEEGHRFKNIFLSLQAFEESLPNLDHRPTEEGWAIIRHNQHLWLQAVLSFCQLVVVSTTDGWNFEVYAKNQADLVLTQAALSSAVQVIESTEWYQTHREHLQWDERNECLKLSKEVD